MIERTKIAKDKSRQVVSIGYDAQSRILEVEFSSGGIYDYTKVPQELYEELIRSDSLGSFIASRIRGAYEYTRLHIEACKRGCSQIDEPICTCWCHKQRKDVSHGAQVPNPSLEKDLKKSIKKAKAAKRIG